MKELRRNLRIIGTLIVCMFVGLAAWYAVTVYDQGTIWASNVYNTRLNRTNLHRGDILDRDGNILAATAEDGSRAYLSDDADRLALSHTVGDTAGMSGTGIENACSATLLDVSSSLTERLSEALSGARRMGSSVQITADGPLTAYISGQFPEGLNGAVCLINYKTGEILAMVSKPQYDPYAPGAEGTADSAYINRCLQGLYTPGSVFKIVTCASALENLPGIETQPITCQSRWDYEGGSVVCGSGTISHGTVDLRNAFAKSCNVAFGKIAYQLGMDRLLATAEQFGFNQNFKFDDVTMYNASFPARARNMSELVWSGVGQASVTVTPLHMCLIAGAIANGGVMMEPKLIRKVQTSLGVVTKTLQSEVCTRVCDEATAAVIGGYMADVVKEGTGKRAAVSGYTVCGKTGSAETSNDKTKATNAWFAGYVRDDAKPYAVAVVIEEGGAGGTQAAALAAKALQKAIELV